MLMWGWQSPLYIYADMDSVTRHMFADPLLKAYAAEGRHPLIVPRLARIVEDVKREQPKLVFCGDPPFPALRDELERDYLPSQTAFRGPNGEGLSIAKAWRDRYDHPEP